MEETYQKDFEHVGKLSRLSYAHLSFYQPSLKLPSHHSLLQELPWLDSTSLYLVKFCTVLFLTILHKKMKANIFVITVIIILLLLFTGHLFDSQNHIQELLDNCSTSTPINHLKSYSKSQ